LNASLRKLEAEYDLAISEKNAAMDEAARCERRLNLAQRLVKALGSENDRWANKIEELEGSLEVLVGDSLLASAFISYAGPFAKQYREIMIQKMFIPYITNNKIPMTKNINPIKLLTDEATIALWNQ
jgi:dynein heavy chain